MLRISKLAAALAVVPIVAFASPVLAANEGQIEGGDIYRIENISKNVFYTDPANADSCNLLEYRVRIHDPGPGTLSNVNVSVDLPSGAATSNISTIFLSSQNASPSVTVDTATLNLSSSQSVSYVNGSTQLLDANGNLLSGMPDGITQGGINIGDVGVSVNNKRFVQFQAKVSCPAPTPTPPVVTTVSTPAKPVAKALPNTGAGDVLGVFTGASALGGAGHYFVSRRRS